MKSVTDKIAELEIKISGYDTPKESIAKAIDLLDFLPNGVASWVEAHSGDKELANKNGKKIKEITNTLGEILSSMPESMVYNVYGLKPAKQTFDTKEKLIEAMKKIKINYTGDSSSGGRTRPELWNQPKFDKLLGPMYDGGGKVRYETQDVYNTLST